MTELPPRQIFTSAGRRRRRPLVRAAVAFLALATVVFVALTLLIGIAS